MKSNARSLVLYREDGFVNVTHILADDEAIQSLHTQLLNDPEFTDIVHFYVEGHITAEDAIYAIDGYYELLTKGRTEKISLHDLET